MFFKEEIYNNFVIDFSTILKCEISNLEVSELIFLCIGTDRVIGDSFGPLVGHKLKELLRNKNNIKIIGSLDNIICMRNISNIISSINNMYDNPFIISIDSALSNKNKVGNIIVSRESTKVGSGFGRKDILAGNISIKGVISKDLKNPKYNFKMLQNIPLSLIMNMSDVVSQGIYDVINV